MDKYIHGCIAYVGDVRTSIYLGLFIGVPHKCERVEGHLLNVADATEHFFVVGYLKGKKKKKIFFLILHA